MKIRDTLMFAILGFIIGWNGNYLYRLRDRARIYKPTEIKRIEKITCIAGVVETAQHYIGEKKDLTICNFDEEEKK